MDHDDLRQLQRLGVDVWVSAEKADELIATGRAKPWNQTGPAEASRPRPPTSRRARSWPSKADSKTDSRGEVNRTLEKSRATHDRTHRERSRQETFEVALRVFLHGPAAVVVPMNEAASSTLISDIALAVSGFETHQLNELYYQFPVQGKTSRGSLSGTVADAQQAFKAWFQAKAAQCQFMVAIGESTIQTVQLLSEESFRMVTIETMPSSVAGKKELWERIKHSTT